jgi:hypothetical protein
VTNQLLERRSVCGPDITTELTDAVTLAGTMFSGWTDEEKDDRCYALISLETGAVAWDIYELYNKMHGWILGYRPACATAQFNTAATGADEVCGNTVEVAGQCYYAGSPNYIIFGKMMRLCRDHEQSKGWWAKLGADDYYGLDKVKSLIWLYKSDSFNYEASRQFAIGGFNGTANYPQGDRPGCYPSCPTPYSGAPFTIRWAGFSSNREAGREASREALR